VSAGRTGGKLLADQLALHGCELAFCVPGESYLPLLDGLVDHRERLRVVTCRHESAAANAAEATGKLTGKPGVCMVTRGPGATQAAVGIHTARQDSTPMVLLVGQVAREHRGREAFQEIDCGEVFGSLAKAVFELDDAARIPEIVASAFTIAASGRQGPVVISLPEDVLAEETSAGDAEPYTPHEPAARDEEVAQLRALLDSSERPFVLVGGGPWDAQACSVLTRWLQRSNLPTGASFRRQDIVDHRLDCYVGDVGLGINPRLAQRIGDADLVVVIGSRLGEVETQGYTLPRPPVPEQRLVHIHPDPDELARVYQPTLGILSGVRPFAAAVSAGAEVDGSRWAHWTRDARRDYEQWSEPPETGGTGDRVDLGAVVRLLRSELPEDAILCNGAGNYTVWLHRFFRYRGCGTQLAPQSGAMGYGVPAALAAQLLHPERTVVALAGDGCFLMAAAELATIVQERAPVIVIVANNGMLGTIRMHQERRFPGRVIGTDLLNPDFTALARSFGADAERVQSIGAFESALERTLAARRPALIEVMTDPRALTPSARLSEAPASAPA
jgi:acetolactate synthase-1/2/3 large subunit